LLRVASYYFDGGSFIVIVDQLYGKRFRMSYSAARDWDGEGEVRIYDGNGDEIPVAKRAGAEAALLAAIEEVLTDPDAGVDGVRKKTLKIAKTKLVAIVEQRTK
jgi:hypothetical protein